MSDRRAIRHSFAFGVCALGIALAAAFGCGKSGVLVPNVPPETIVFVNGTVDTVSHIVRLRWFGSDRDGRVDRFEFKWIYEAGGEPAGYDSSLWFSTTRQDSTFSVYTPNGVSMPTFVIRAVDDAGEPDPTPARQLFAFRNEPPTITLPGVPALSDTTFPVATIRWTATDPDGDVRLAHYLVWLDGQAANPQVVSGRKDFTLTPPLFSDGAGGYVTGVRTVFVQAVDQGGAVSAPASFTWRVVPPVGNVLLLDDTPDDDSGPVDGSYTDALDRQLGVGNYTVIHLEVSDPFRSSDDLRYTFGFFDSIVWYADNAPRRSGTLRLAEAAIRAHLAAGKSIFLTSVWAIGTGGALTTKAFLHDIVGADSLVVNAAVATTNFPISTDAVLHPGPAVPYDSLSALVIVDNVEALILQNTNDAAYIARPPVLAPTQTQDWAVGVDRIPPGGTGRFVLFTFPLRLLGGTPVGAPPPDPDAHYGERTVRRVLARFGHGASP